MTDLISREAAIADGKSIDELDTPIGILVNLPPEQQWIPVSERPKKVGRYLVTRLDYVTDTEFIDILWYENNTWWNRRATGDYAVTAWMPLPKPYKETDNG